MATKPLTPKTYRALPIAIILAVILAGIFLQHYLLIIMTAAIVAFTFHPVYAWMTRWISNKTLASWLTVFLSIFVVIIPVAIVVYATIHELQGVASSITSFITSQDPSTTVSNILTKVNELLGRLSGGHVSLSIEDIRGWAGQAASFVGNNAAGWASGIFGSVSSFITASIIFLYLFAGMLVHHSKITHYIRALNPLGDEVTDLYLSRTASMTQSMVRGQFIIAAVQGVISALLLYIVGIQYFWVAALLLTFLSIIPLGSGIIVIPIGVVMLLMGNIWQGLLLILGHIVFITNIDNVLRPLLVPKNARLNPALVLLSVFAGLGFFGVLGVVIGPVIMILLITTLEVYMEAIESGEVKTASKEVAAKKPVRFRSWINKLRSKSKR